MKYARIKVGILEGLHIRSRDEAEIEKPHKEFSSEEKYILHVYAANGTALKYSKLKSDRTKRRNRQNHNHIGTLYTYISQTIKEAARIYYSWILEICHSQQISMNQICTGCIIR